LNSFVFQGYGEGPFGFAKMIHDQIPGNAVQPHLERRAGIPVGGEARNHTDKHLSRQVFGQSGVKYFGANITVGLLMVGKVKVSYGFRIAFLRALD
jgi:hypothetical protein